MKTVNITQARAKLYQIVADASQYSEPIMITNSKGKNAILIGEDDWNALQETLYLSSMPGMAESIINGSKEDVSQCVESASF